MGANQSNKSKISISKPIESAANFSKRQPHEQHKQLELSASWKRNLNNALKKINSNTYGDKNPTAAGQHSHIHIANELGDTNGQLNTSYSINGKTSRSNNYVGPPGLDMIAHLKQQYQHHNQGQAFNSKQQLAYSKQDQELRPSAKPYEANNNGPGAVPTNGSDAVGKRAPIFDDGHVDELNSSSSNNPASNYYYGKRMNSQHMKDESISAAVEASGSGGGGSNFRQCRPMAFAATEATANAPQLSSNGLVLGRSQQQQHHQLNSRFHQNTTSPYHLSMAVNTKTSHALNQANGQQNYQHHSHNQKHHNITSNTSGGNHNDHNGAVKSAVATLNGHDFVDNRVCRNTTNGNGPNEALPVNNKLNRQATYNNELEASDGRSTIHRHQSKSEANKFNELAYQHSPVISNHYQDKPQQYHHQQASFSIGQQANGQYYYDVRPAFSGHLDDNENRRPHYSSCYPIDSELYIQMNAMQQQQQNNQRDLNNFNLMTSQQQQQHLGAIDYQTSYNNVMNRDDNFAHNYRSSTWSRNQLGYQDPQLDPNFGFYDQSLRSKGSHTLDHRSNKSQNPFASLFTKDYSKQANTFHSSHRNNSSTMSTSQVPSSGSKYHDQRSCPGSLKRVKSSPLNAQQASYEAMRTIDMYLIRQIARSCMDPLMEQKIELEIRLRELASQSLLEARNEIDLLEVEKSLLASDQRMNCYAIQLEDQRKQLSNPSLSTDSGRSSKSGAGGSSKRRQSTPKQQAIQGSLLQRSDVIGPPGADTTSNSNNNNNTATGSNSSQSPTNFSSLSTGSPSKLSPVSGQSNAGDQVSLSSGLGGGVGGHHSRTNFRQLSSGKNQLSSARQRAQSRRREQLLQAITSQSNINCNMVVNNRASVSVSDIRLPLMWRELDHFKGRGDYKRYAIFCLLKIGSQIYDTQLISDVDRNCTDVTFDDLIVFNDVEHNFELKLEVYSCVYLEQFSLSSAPRKLKERLSNSIGRAMGRKLSTQTANSNYTKELEAYEAKSYRFALIASASLRVDDASPQDSVKTYDLSLTSPAIHHKHYQLNSQVSGSSLHHDHHRKDTSLQRLSGGSSESRTTTRDKRPFGFIGSGNTKDAEKNTLPLFGHFCCKLLVRPDVFDKNIKSGYLKVAMLQVQPEGAAVAASVAAATPGSDSGDGGSLVARSSDSPSSSSSQQSDSQQRNAILIGNKMATLSKLEHKIYWALLRNFSLYLWPVEELEVSSRWSRARSAGRSKSRLAQGELLSMSPNCVGPAEQANRGPRYTIGIDKFARLVRVSNSSLTIDTDRGCFVLAACQHEVTSGQNASNELTTDDIGAWLRVIEQMIYDSHIWGAVLSHTKRAQAINSGDLQEMSTASRSRSAARQQPYRHRASTDVETEHSEIAVPMQANL